MCNAGILVGGCKIQTPLPDIPRHVRTTIRTDAVLAYRRRASRIRFTDLAGPYFAPIPVIPPGIFVSIWTACRLFPLPLRRQMSTGPLTIVFGILPGDIHDRMLFF